MEIRQTEPVKNVPWKSVQCVQKMGTVCLVCFNGWDMQGNECKKLSLTEIALIGKKSYQEFILRLFVSVLGLLVYFNQNQV